MNNGREARKEDIHHGGWVVWTWLVRQKITIVVCCHCGNWYDGERGKKINSRIGCLYLVKLEDM